MADRAPGDPVPRVWVQSYGDGGFRISGQSHAGAVLLFPDRVEPWGAKSVAGITRDSLAPVFAEASPPTRILLVGCGERIAPLDAAVGAALRAAGIGVELMDTGAACRTFNVLAGEGRAVAAALLPVGAAVG